MNITQLHFHQSRDTAISDLLYSSLFLHEEQQATNSTVESGNAFCISFYEHHMKVFTPFDFLLFKCIYLIFKEQHITQKYKYGLCLTAESIGEFSITWSIFHIKYYPICIDKLCRVQTEHYQIYQILSSIESYNSSDFFTDINHNLSQNKVLTPEQKLANIWMLVIWRKIVTAARYGF